MISRKGQGLSLNVIIVAALALIVLVILVMVFTGRIGIFQKDIDKASKTDLLSLKITYGDCHPTATDEATFSSESSQAASPEDKDLAEAKFKDRIASCKGLSSRDECESGGCQWS